MTMETALGPPDREEWCFLVAGPPLPPAGRAHFSPRLWKGPTRLCLIPWMFLVSRRGNRGPEQSRSLAIAGPQCLALTLAPHSSP